MLSKIYEYCNCYKYNYTIVMDCYNNYDDAKKNLIEHPHNYYVSRMIIVNKLLPLFMKNFIINTKFHVDITKK